MYDTHRVCSIENTHDRYENFNCFGGSKSPTCLELVGEGVSFDKLHHHVDRAVSSGAKIVNRYRIRMSKTARGLALASESSQPLGICSDFRRKDFDGDTIAKQNMTRTIDCAHPAFTEQRFHLVLPVEHSIDDRGGIGFQHLR